MDQVGSFVDRPRMYNNIDGLVELGGGVMCLGVALGLSLPANSIWHKSSWVLFLGVFFGIPYGIKVIKAHITYPRTGFVEYRKRASTRIISAAFGALVTVGLGVAVRRHWDITAPASLFGLAFAASYAYNIARGVRWKWVVASAIALDSIVVAFLPADVLAAMAHDSLVTHPVLAKFCGTIVASFMTYGAILLISGAISFWLYLRHTQAPALDGQ